MKFTRRGTVRLVRTVDAPEQWSTKSGAAMTASVGDLIVSDGASHWSITRDEFDRTYRLLDGDTYERRGEVEAVLARPGQVVQSVEGPQTAVAGDWLVTNDRGFTWLVPWSHFVRSYSPSPGTETPPSP